MSVCEKEIYTLSETTQNGIPCVVVKGIRDFDVALIFDCGQCFRFMPVESEYDFAVGGVAFGKYVEFCQSGDTLVIRNANTYDFEHIWKRFLSLDLDYGEIKKELSEKMNSPVFDKAAEIGSGIRILRQEPWECVCSFIVSQNNNIPRIRKIIEAMCEKYGNKIEFEGKAYYSFPSPERLADAGVDEIFKLRCGFRAKYIHDAATLVSEKKINLDKLFALGTKDAESELCRIKGVGPKVAACALLFAFEKYDAFPIDVWVKKILEKYFPDGLDINTLGRYAGIAQQYLFYYERYTVGREKGDKVE